jgi:hypothetical protein
MSDTNEEEELDMMMEEGDEVGGDQLRRVVRHLVLGRGAG